MTKFPKYDFSSCVYCSNDIEYLHKKDPTSFIKELPRFGWLELIREVQICVPLIGYFSTACTLEIAGTKTELSFQSRA